MPDSSGIAGLQQQMGSALSDLRQQTGSAPAPQPTGGDYIASLQPQLKGVFNSLRQQTGNAPASNPAGGDYLGMVQQATQQAPNDAYQRMLAQALNGKTYDELFPKAAAPTPVATAPVTPVFAGSHDSANAPFDNGSYVLGLMGDGGSGAGTGDGAASSGSSGGAAGADGAGGDGGASSSGGGSAFRRGGLVPPTEAQKHAGNYQKHHVSFQGLPISIENPKGSVRKGKGWRCVMPADYGYIKRTEGADGDHLDVFVGPDKDSQIVFVINQNDHRTGQFDETKTMLGYSSERAAVADYIKAFSDGKGRARIRSVEPISLDTFKHWLKRGRTKGPARTKSLVEHALAVTRSR